MKDHHKYLISNKLVLQKNKHVVTLQNKTHKILNKFRKKKKTLAMKWKMQQFVNKIK